MRLIKLTLLRNPNNHSQIKETISNMIKTGVFIAAATLLASTAEAYTDAAVADQVTNLPGAEKLDISFNQFSGYLNIPGSSGDSKFMHYW